MSPTLNYFMKFLKLSKTIQGPSLSQGSTRIGSDSKTKNQVIKSGSGNQHISKVRALTIFMILYGSCNY